MRGFAILLVAVLSLVGITAKLTSVDDNPPAVAGLLTESDPPPGFEYALEPRTFVFPKDHSSHPKFRSEWWYFTGNVESDDGVPFGFQLTLFRFALRPRPRESSSLWRTNDIYLGHFALSDFTAGVFHKSERQSRAALDLAGAGGDPPKIWIRDWSIELTDVDQEVWQLKAQEAGVAIDLTASALRPVIAHGDRGLSKKSAQPGNASYYYSIPRLSVAGSITTPTENHQVSGNAWFDHEWSTSALAEGQLGWDWFSLQLSNGSGIMFYQIRNAQGHTEAVSHGVIQTENGNQTPLRADEIQITITQHWQSPTSGARYPAAWQIRIPSHAIELSVSPRLAQQEWDKNFVYWEGAVVVTGAAAAERVNGIGYVELVGYE